MKPRLPKAHETPTPPGEGEPFVVLLVGDGYEEGSMDPDRTLRELMWDTSSTPIWARTMIASALDADPMDTANVLNVLARAFAERAKQITEAEAEG